MTWTREHDRTLAEKCERLKVRRWDELPIAQRDYDYCPDELFIGASTHDRLPHYNTDPAAEKRAAEAWRLQETGRHYKTASPKIYTLGKRTITNPASAACLQNEFYVKGTGKHLYEALYEAVRDE